MYQERCLRSWEIQWWVDKPDLACLYGGLQSGVECVKETSVFFFHIIPFFLTISNTENDRLVKIQTYSYPKVC